LAAPVWQTIDEMQSVLLYQPPHPNPGSNELGTSPQSKLLSSIVSSFTFYADLSMAGMLTDALASAPSTPNLVHLHSMLLIMFFCLKFN
jgi:hypothetical protein